MVRHAQLLAYVLGYMGEAETEANNLVSIATGKELGLEELRIERALCM
jgi:vacuolar-type H+-ATPase subunit C/Vma6